MVQTILSFVMWVAGLLGFGKPADPNKAERDTGEALGKAETGEANAVAGLREIDTANKARGDAAADLTAHPDRVRDSDPNMVAPGSDGIS